MEQLIELTELHQILQDYAKEAEEIYKYQIALGNKNASRKLVDTIKSNVKVGDKSYEVTLNLQHYWKYIEGGTKGTESSPAGAVYPAHFPPPWALERWINFKPILPRPNQFGKIPSPKSLSYAMAHTIERKGIKPHPALQTTQEELHKIYYERLAVALGHDVGRYIQKLFAER